MIDPKWRIKDIEKLKLSEEKVNNDRSSEVEKKAKKDANKQFDKIMGVTANAEAQALQNKVEDDEKKAEGGSQSGSEENEKAKEGGDANATGASGETAKGSEEEEEEAKKKMADLETHDGNITPDTKMDSKKEKFDLLVRSKVVVDVASEDPEEWKLALVMVNLS
jgi:hypothetical protein